MDSMLAGKPVILITRILKGQKMTCELVSRSGSWREVADCANVTVNRPVGSVEPTSSWKRRMLLSEHSPIRKLWFDFKWTDLESWVSVHIVRHKIGIEHFVRTQRTDRTGVDRKKLPQDSLVEHRITINAQALITISRKRLCMNASPETRDAWTALLHQIKDIEPELYSACVVECVYRGYCPDFKKCGYSTTEDFQVQLEYYRTKSFI